MLYNQSALAEIDKNIPDVTIVGAGAVGLLMAVDLARKGRNVLVLEAGPAIVSQQSQSFFEEATYVGRTLGGLHLGRFRALGGATNFWGGQLVCFDPITFESRPWVADDAEWPIRYAEIEPYYRHAFNVLGMRDVIMDDVELLKRFAISPPPLPDDLQFFFTHWMPEPNLAILFRDEIKKLPNLRVVLNAPVVALNVEPTDGSISALTIAEACGKRISLPTKQVVLANGTVEIARLLSLPLADGSKPTWADNPWLGRGYIDHVDSIAGEVKPRNSKEFHNLFDNAFAGGFKYQPKLRLSEKAQREQELLGIAVHFIFKSSITENLANAKIFFKSFLRGRFAGPLAAIPKQLATIASVGLPMIIRYLRYRRMYNPSDLGVQLRLTSEQRRVVESGLVLRQEVDAFGVPLVGMDWRIDNSDLETMARFAEMIKDYLTSSGLADVELNPRLVNRDPSFLDDADDAYHHIGMARMSDDPSAGVVDRDLKVHGTKNLYVAGAAVYPSSGFANPTFTAMALGLRLTEALHKRGIA